MRISKLLILELIGMPDEYAKEYPDMVTELRNPTYERKQTR